MNDLIHLTNYLVIRLTPDHTERTNGQRLSPPTDRPAIPTDLILNE